jgi:hypothetical protein
MHLWYGIRVRWHSTLAGYDYILLVWQGYHLILLMIADNLDAEECHGESHPSQTLGFRRWKAEILGEVRIRPPQERSLEILGHHEDFAHS